MLQHNPVFYNPLEKVVLKEETVTERLVVSSHVLTPKHKVEQQLLTWEQLFQLLQETNKQPFLDN